MAVSGRGPVITGASGNALASYLTEPEVEALLAVPARSTRTGRDDHVLIVLAAQTITA